MDATPREQINKIPFGSKFHLSASTRPEYETSLSRGCITSQEESNGGGTFLD